MIKLKLPPSPLNRINRRKIALTKLVAPVQISILLLATIVTPLLKPPTQVSAWTETTMPKCSVNSFQTFDWKDKMNEKVNSNFPDANTLYDIENATSYIFYQTSPTSKIRADIVMVSTKLFEVYKESGVYKIQHGINPADYQNPSWVHYAWEIDPVAKTVTNVGVIPSFNNRSTSTPYPTTNVHCIYSVKGLNYALSYDGNEFDEALPPQGSEKCSGVDIGCYIQKAFKGVSDTFLGVGQAILRGISYLFVPSEGAINTQVSSLREFLDDKLGFIVYPFSFTVDLWNAMLNTDNSWCTPSSCSKNLGNFMGSNYTIDFFKLNHVIPQAFLFMQNSIRAITILGLIHLARTKYSEVTQK